MNAYFHSGRAIDVILLIIAAEFLALAFMRRGEGGMGRIFGLFLRLAPGACILVALRGALTGAGWPWIALWLGLSFPLHIGDLWRRR